MPVDLPSKVNGRARYSIDVQLDGMLFGAVLRAPVEGSVPDKIDDSEVRKIPNVVTVVRMPWGVGVIAETPWAAFEGRRALAEFRDLEQDRRSMELQYRRRSEEIFR